MLVLRLHGGVKCRHGVEQPSQQQGKGERASALARDHDVALLALRGLNFESATVSIFLSCQL